MQLLRAADPVCLLRGQVMGVRGGREIESELLPAGLEDPTWLSMFMLLCQ